jgi:hypothetical protein
MADETLKRLNQLVEEPDTSFLGNALNRVENVKKTASRQT